ncbi:MAG: hypothetical protein OXC40_03020 [Proteobacteria bacterium]|nr:hypothetical protein [Pseudomonadota bacterium]
MTSVKMMGSSLTAKASYDILAINGGEKNNVFISIDDNLHS